MVVGKGLMASAFDGFKNNEDVIIFASGVSKSTETDNCQFEREFQLLQQTIQNYPKAQLVYFSTCSIEDAVVNTRPYIKHKLDIESYIKAKVPKYVIFRISNVVGESGNENTIMNYLYDAVKNNLPIEIWKHTERNLIDIDDVKFLVENVLNDSKVNRTINLATSKSCKVVDILALIESYLGKQANANMLNKGNPIDINVTDISRYLKIVERDKGSGLDYIENLLKKYYKK